MTDSEKWKERWDQVARYRVMEQETTDPLAAGLLRGIVSELEAEIDERRTLPVIARATPSSLDPCRTAPRGDDSARPQRFMQRGCRSLWIARRP
jgi:hypothetical protein